MQFRWIAAITVWTIISGPIFAPPMTAPASLREHSLAATPPQSHAARQANSPPTVVQPR